METVLLFARRMMVRKSMLKGFFFFNFLSSVCQILCILGGGLQLFSDQDF
jgi:hypothetical protein